MGVRILSAGITELDPNKFNLNSNEKAFFLNKPSGYLYASTMFTVDGNISSDWIEWVKYEDDEDYENYLARLDEELELAIENKDAMSAEAIRIKKEELKKKQDKEKEEAIRVQDFEKAAKIRDKENAKKKELEDAKKEWETKSSKNVSTLKEGVGVIHRTDYNYSEVADKIKDDVVEFSTYSSDDIKNVRGCASKLSEKALWKHFIQYYYEAYDIALRNAEKRMKQQ